MRSRDFQLRFSVILLAITHTHFTTIFSILSFGLANVRRKKSCVIMGIYMFMFHALLLRWGLRLRGRVQGTMQVGTHAIEVGIVFDHAI